MKKHLKWLLGLSLAVLILTACTHSNPQAESNSTDTLRTSTPHSSLKKKLDVPVISQNPELKNGCEVTSLAMLLQYAGINVDKMTLANKIQKDPSPLEYDEEGAIKSWGDPDKGFVGDITGQEKGFGVYPAPLLALLNIYLPGRGINLSRQSFDALLQSINQGRPVIVWVTMDFNVPDEYAHWNSQDKTITATFDEHAVLLVGYDKKYCFINNPYTGEQNQKVKKAVFKKVWDIMGNMAVSYV